MSKAINHLGSDLFVSDWWTSAHVHPLLRLTSHLEINFRQRTTFTKFSRLSYPRPLSLEGPAHPSGNNFRVRLRVDQRQFGAFPYLCNSPWAQSTEEHLEASVLILLGQAGELWFKKCDGELWAEIVGYYLRKSSSSWASSFHSGYNLLCLLTCLRPVVNGAYWLILFFRWKTGCFLCNSEVFRPKKSLCDSLPLSLLSVRSPRAVEI